MLGGFAAEIEAVFPALAGFARAPESVCRSDTTLTWRISGRAGPLGPRRRPSAQPLRVLTVVVVTATLFAVTLLAALMVVLVFVTQIRAFMAETSTALEVTNDGASRLAGLLEGMQRATAAAVSELRTPPAAARDERWTS